jgi:LDH2 family malate/lactate/ureidoglycolate dehydrogenase
LQPSDNPVGEGLGHFFGVMRVDAFRPKEDFMKHMDNWISTFRNSGNIQGEAKVLIPGDPEREMEIERMANGIPLLPPVVDDMKVLAAKFDLEF